MKKLITMLMLFGCLTMSSFMTSPFATIVSGVPLDYASYQVKITYTGEQLKAAPSLLLTGSGRVANKDEFIPYRSANVRYSNDDAGVFEISLSGTTIKKFVDALALRPELCTSGGRTQPVLSLMIERNVAPAEIVFEHLADMVEAHTILNLLEGAIATEPSITKTNVRRFRNYTIGHH